MNRFCSLYFPWLIWMAAIFYFSSIPDLRITEEELWDLILRKGAHIVIFGVLFLLSWRISAQQKVAKPYLWAFIWAVVYAVSDEFHQAFIPTRCAGFFDVLIDSFGILIAGLWLLDLLKILRKKLKYQ